MIKTPGLQFWPEYNEWVTPTMLVGIPAAYLAGIGTLHLAMSCNKKVDFDGPLVKNIMRVYNLVQIVLCSYMVLGLVGNFAHFPNIFGINNAFDARTEWYILVHYWSKLLDFFDTVFIVLRRKTRQLSFLHLFHHATIFPQWGVLLLLGVGNGTTGFGALANSIIHVI